MMGPFQSQESCITDAECVRSAKSASSGFISNVSRAAGARVHESYLLAELRTRCGREAMNGCERPAYERLLSVLSGVWTFCGCAVFGLLANANIPIQSLWMHPAY
jgi:hypothetical protein